MKELQKLARDWRIRARIGKLPSHVCSVLEECADELEAALSSADNAPKFVQISVSNGHSPQFGYWTTYVSIDDQGRAWEREVGDSVSNNDWRLLPSLPPMTNGGEG